MSTKTAHTPTPWKIEIIDKEGIHISAEPIDFMIATCFCEPPDDVTSENAQFIVLAVNHHQELVTRLYNLVNALDTQTVDSNPNNLTLRVNEARETLSKIIK